MNQAAPDRFRFRLPLAAHPAAGAIIAGLCPPRAVVKKRVVVFALPILIDFLGSAEAARLAGLSLVSVKSRSKRISHFRYGRALSVAIYLSSSR